MNPNDGLIKTFDNFNQNDWQEDLLSLYDIFCELEDFKICRIEYQGGYRTSYGNRSYPCYLNNGKIEGNIEHVSSMLNINSKSLLRVQLVEINYQGHSPFKQTHAPSFYAGDANIFLQIMGYIDIVKKRMFKYNLGITFDEYVIYLDFLKKDNNI